MTMHQNLRERGFQTEGLLAPGQALTQYFAHANLRSPEIEFVPLEHAFARVIAQRIGPDAPFPAAPRSAMDGFALRSADTPGNLHIAGEVRMGRAWTGQLPPHGAVRIPTGGMLPGDADAVVPIEDVHLDGDTVHVLQHVQASDCVTPAGSDMRPGEVLLEPGRRVGGPDLALLATLGVVSVPVYRKPLFSVISSGDELVDAWSVPGPAQIRDSNRWAVSGTLQALGAAVRHLPIAPDEPERLEALLREALATSDGVILSGGSSVGERDLTPGIVARLGSPGVLVHGLKVKPGKPTVLASIDGKAVIGLPGNPTSALLISEAIAAPIIAALAGTRPRRFTIEATLAAPLSKRLGWTWYMPMYVDESAHPPLAHPLELRSSSVSLLARAGGYAILGEEIESLQPGTVIRVRRFLQGGV
jgi:molybdopterin molybdotransferase